MTADSITAEDSTIIQRHHRAAQVRDAYTGAAADAEPGKPCTVYTWTNNAGTGFAYTGPGASPLDPNVTTLAKVWHDGGIGFQSHRACRQHREAFALLADKPANATHSLQRELDLANAELDRLIDQARAELTNVMDACSDAIRRLDTGRLPNSLGPLQGAVAHANAHCGAVHVAAKSRDRLQALLATFGG